MKFCPQCNSRLISNECHNWKCTEGKVIQKRKPNSSWNYLYAKTKPCYKGCGGVIYFDDDYKSENDKFVQRIGRAGRREQKSFVMCVFEPRAAVCRYYANNISEYLHQEHIVQINKDILSSPKSMPNRERLN